MKNNIRLPQLAWHGMKELEISLPESWQVNVCNMAGYDRPALPTDAIREAVRHPLGMLPLREYARGRKEVVIIFDDMARVTRVSGMVPAVLEELAEAGIRDSQIRFIAACGCHGAMTRTDFARKLGEDVLARFPVYNHSPFTNCVEVGTTTSGTRVCLNAEFMRCDLKIGIGSIVPHIMAGYGGGGKLVFPGMAAYESIVALHSPRPSTGNAGFNGTVTGMGIYEDNPRRRDIDEAVIMAGLDMKLDALVNRWGETVEVFAGSPAPAYAAALEAARPHYLTPPSGGNDIVIANTFAKANEAISGLLIAFPAVSHKGGDIVLIANAPDGQITHYLMGPFGSEIGGELMLRMNPPENVKRLIIFSEYPEHASLGYIDADERVVMLHRWDEVQKLLEVDHGPGTRVAVFPNADIQYSVRY